MGVIEEIKRLDPETYILEPEQLYKLVHKPNELQSKVAQTLRLILEKTGLRGTFVGGFTLTAKSEYGLKRMWNTWFSVREFVQNALDTGKFAYMRYSGNDIEILDNGPGVKPSHVIFFGAGEKECWQRGAFGEGMKIAMIYLESQNMPTLIITRFAGINEQLAYRMVLIDNLPIFLVFTVEGAWHITSNPTFTLVRVMDAYNDYVASLKMEDLPDTALAFFNIDRIKELGGEIYSIKTETNNCPHPMNEYLVYTPNENYRGILWVRDIFVNKMENILYGSRYKFFFSYNLWWIDLDPNRTTVSATSRWSMKDEIRTLIEKVVSGIDQLKREISKLWKITVETIGGSYRFYIFSDDLLREYYEYDMLPPEFLAETIVESLYDNQIRVYAIASKINYDVMAEAAHTIGLNSYLVVENTDVAKALMKKLNLPDLFDLYADRLKKEANQKKVDYNTDPVLKNYHDIFLEFVRHILGMSSIDLIKDIDFVSLRSQYIPPTKIINLDVSKARNYIKNGAFEYAFDDLFRALVHELAHHIAFAKYGKGEDLTEEHVMGFEKLAKLLAQYADLTYTVQRTLSGHADFEFLMGDTIRSDSFELGSLMKLPMELDLLYNRVLIGKTEQEKLIAKLGFIKRIDNHISRMSYLPTELKCIKFIRSTAIPREGENEVIAIPLLLYILSKTGYSDEEKKERMRYILNVMERCREMFSISPIIDLDKMAELLKNTPTLLLKEYNVDDMKDRIEELYKFMRKYGIGTTIY